MGKNFKAVLLGGSNILDLVYSEEALKRAEQYLEWIAEPIASHFQDDKSQIHIPEETEIILSTWGMVDLDEDRLKALPNLKAVFYGAGSVRGFLTDHFWDRNIHLSAAASGNAVPVAEYTLGLILTALKFGPMMSRKRVPLDRNILMDRPGNYHAVIGLISYGVIARILRQYLKMFSHRIIVYDPFLSDDEAEREMVKKVSLEELLERSHVVSVHTPLLPETRGMLRKEHILRMRDKGILINTSRGAVFNEPELVEALTERQDIQAYIDVVEKEPIDPNHPLLDLVNVYYTPHIAGSTGYECARMGDMMIDELERFAIGQPLRYGLTRFAVQRMA